MALRRTVRYLSYGATMYASKLASLTVVLFEARKACPMIFQPQGQSNPLQKVLLQK